jgi:hypothetical protein
MNDEQMYSIGRVITDALLAHLPKGSIAWAREGKGSGERTTVTAMGRAAEEATREQHYREALAEPTDEEWEYLAKQGGKHLNGIWRSDVEQMLANRLARLLPKPQTDPAIEAAANAIRQPGSMVGAGVVEKIVAAVRKADASLPSPPPASDPQPFPYQEAKPAAQCKHEHPRRGYHPGEYFCGDCMVLITPPAGDALRSTPGFLDPLYEELAAHKTAPQAAPDAVTEALEAFYGHQDPEWGEGERNGMTAALTAFSKLVSETARRIVERDALGSVSRGQRKQYVKGVLAATFKELLPDKERE